MASAAEQLAANINFGAIAKAEELKKRIWFTLGALIVFRLGTYIPLPGIDPEALRQTLDEALSQTRETLDELRALAGGAKLSIDVLPVCAEGEGRKAAMPDLLGRLELRLAQLSGHV